MGGATCGSVTFVWRRPRISLPLSGLLVVPAKSSSSTALRYATNFLYRQRRPSWRRQTCPRTSRPVMLRLGMMTRRRCQVVGLAVRRSNPNLRMVMAVNLIVGMLTHSAQAARCRHRHSGHLGTPHRSRDCRPLPRPITLPRAIPFRSPRHENHSESGGHSGQRNPDFELSYNHWVVTAIFLPAMIHRDP